MRLNRKFFEDAVSKATISTPFGTMTAVFSENGLRGLLWPDDLHSQGVKQCLKMLREEQSDHLKSLKRELDEFSKSNKSVHSIPLDAVGSEFQKKVWQGLTQIKAGSTRSYSDFACDIGLTTSSTRAVASAIAKNPISLLWPCHRVIAKDGSLGGFAGGLKAKKALLEAEKNKS